MTKGAGGTGPVYTGPRHVDVTEVAEALAAARVPGLAQPTLDAGEGWQGLLLADATFDPDIAAARGTHYENLDQLALEYLMGAR